MKCTGHGIDHAGPQARRRTAVRGGLAMVVLAILVASGHRAATARELTEPRGGQASATPSSQEQRPMKIRLTVHGATFGATLADHPVSRDFVSMLPLRLQLRDYASAEKIADLPRKLTTQGVPAGTSAQAGDLSYYAPWGNIALFYKPAPHAAGLVRLGQLDLPVETLRQLREGSVLIERASD